MNAALLSSEKMDWETPDNILELVREFNGGRIGFDPCTTSRNPCDADMFICPPGSAFQTEWHGYGLVYCNPPYGRELASWARKMAHSGNAVTRSAEIIGLVPARPDTRWWHENIVSAHAICFWRGRLKFKGAPASAPFPSALPYWGPRPARFREVFGPHGWIVT